MHGARLLQLGENHTLFIQMCMNHTTKLPLFNVRQSKKDTATATPCSDSDDKMPPLQTSERWWCFLHVLACGTMAASLSAMLSRSWPSPEDSSRVRVCLASCQAGLPKDRKSLRVSCRVRWNHKQSSQLRVCAMWQCEAAPAAAPRRCCLQEHCLLSNGDSSIT